MYHSIVRVGFKLRILEVKLGILDYFIGGNPLISAKSTVKIFFEGKNIFGSLEKAYRYLYIFRNNTITKHLRCDRDILVSEMFQSGEMINCTYITIANLNTGAAPKNTLFEETYFQFHDEISNYLREYGIPEQYVSGNNRDCIEHIANYLCTYPIVSPEIRNQLILC